MARKVLTAGFAQLAVQLQEAAGDLSNGDVCKRLSDALRDCFQDSGQWAYYIDHFGDDTSGDVIYSCNGDTMRAPYSISDVNGKSATQIDTESAIDVMPRTIYEEEADDTDHYTAMEAAKLYRSKTEFPVYERFISKDERTTAPSGSFAGKGKSFPILKPADVMAAVRSMGRAGSENYSTDTIKANIIRIAKAKGWTKELPKAWQGSDAKESAVSRETGSLKLVESINWANSEVLSLIESAGAVEKEIRIIVPGKGSSAIYPEEVLKRDGPKVFTKGTQIYIDHATKTEEADRPEGDWHKLAGALSTDAYWKEASGDQKAALYAKARFASDIAPAVIEKAPWSGMSIRANGNAVTEGGKPILKDGLPTLKEFTRCESIDIVTRAGAGGMILTEAARAANSNQEDSEMEAAELKKLQESVTAQAALNAKLLERAIRGDAREEAARVLKPLSLAEAAKQRVIESVTRDFAAIPQMDGQLDTVKFTEAVNAAAKDMGAFVAQVTGSGQVRGMGAPIVEIDAKEAERRQSDAKKLRESLVRSYQDIGLPLNAAEAAADRANGEAA